MILNCRLLRVVVVLFPFVFAHCLLNIFWIYDAVIIAVSFLKLYLWVPALNLCIIMNIHMHNDIHIDTNINICMMMNIHILIYDNIIRVKNVLFNGMAIRMKYN